MLTRRRVLSLAVALVLVAGAGWAGRTWWERAHGSRVAEALAAVPEGSQRVAFTDWAQVRGAVGSSGAAELIEAAYDVDLSAVSSLDEAAAVLDERFGFSPGNAEWEAFAQGPEGAATVIQLPDVADLDQIADNLAELGYARPGRDDGVWEAGQELIPRIDPTLTPELQYVVLLADQGRVVTSDQAGYARSAAKVAAGEDEGLGKDAVALVDSLPESVAEAMVWVDDFACEDLAMSQADATTQDQADRAIAEAGGLTPLTGLAMSMSANREFTVVARAESADQARASLEPRAELAVGEAYGRGGSFADIAKLTRSRTDGANVVLTFAPRNETGFVLSALYDGPVVFASC